MRVVGIVCRYIGSEQGVALNKAKLGMRRKLSKEVQTKLTRCCLEFSFTLRHELFKSSIWHVVMEDWSKLGTPLLRIQWSMSASGHFYGFGTPRPCPS